MNIIILYKTYIFILTFAKVNGSYFIYSAINWNLTNYLKFYSESAK